MKAEIITDTKRGACKTNLGQFFNQVKQIFASSGNLSIFASTPMSS